MMVSISLPYYYILTILLFVWHHNFVFSHNIIQIIEPSLEITCSQGGFLAWNINDKRPNSTIEDKCQAFYDDFVTHAGEFIRCELNYSSPFRMCGECVVQYERSSVTFKDFMTESDLEDCRTKYVKADRVQVIPSLQHYIDDLWNNAACSACSSNVNIDRCTGEVNYTIPDEVLHFMDLFQNLSICLNTSLEDENTRFWKYDKGHHNGSMCRTCLSQYNEINSHYGRLSSSMDGNICMDIVDRMNYTRLVWSHHFGCGNTSRDNLVVIIIAIVVGVLPLIFYPWLRHVGKEKKSKVIKQKRLAPAGSSTPSSILNRSTFEDNPCSSVST